ncbi:RNA-guided endonuclease InsQ/TnpB family protein [Ligilactobacillus sp.]|uniref:RNA-guided endonuclease InsQ/TnpB family protein n=1 Tax=Ligilactobacillus sp. TaxID=2767921 RepID=UPI002FE32E2A
MIPEKELTKTVRSTRTYRFKVTTKNIEKEFLHAQQVKKTYFNYGLKYLYQHYGVKKLDKAFPSGKSRKYLINRMIEFSRKKAEEKDFDLKKEDYNVQSVAKMYEELCVAFEKYRKGQYKLKRYWTDKQKQEYLKKHNCNLDGYMRINYKHTLDEVRSIKFKQNKGQLALVNNYVVKLPYLKRIMVKESLSLLKNKQIQEVCVVRRPNGDYELQIIVKFQKTKDISKEQVSKTVGLDVNMANNDFFTISDDRHITWTKEVEQKYNKLDNKARALQTVINAHNHGNDNSKVVKIAKKLQTKSKTKMANIIDEWQLTVAKELVESYPVLAMEQLNSFEMRLSKRYYKSIRKNTNNKLAKIQPTMFRIQMECVYQNEGGILLEVNSIDTSKTCHKCEYINHDLKVGVKQWKCPNCGKDLNRDLNATYNIRDWALDVKKHAVLKQRAKYPFLDEKNLVEII